MVSKTANMNFKCPLKLRTEFTKQCKKDMQTPSNVLRQFMAQYVVDAKQLNKERRP